MASLCRRYKWFLRSSMPLYKKELLFFVVLVLGGTLVVHMIVTMEQNDGTYIDLSPQRQKELIADWMEQREKQKQEQVSKEDQEGVDSELDRRLEQKAWQLVEQVEKKRRQRLEQELQQQQELEFGAGYDDVNEDDFDYANGALGKADAGARQKEGNGDEGGDQFQGKGLEGGRAECTIYDVTKDQDREFECLTLKLKPSVLVCLHPHKDDVHVSRALSEEGIWEPHLVAQFQNMLYGEPELGFIDIGAHVGMYSLIAANMGHTVVAVEPMDANLVRFHKAVKMSHVEDKITLVKNVVSDSRRIVSLKTFSDNKGGTAVDEEDPCYAKGCKPNVKAIYMDDLLEVINFKRAIIKIDIEGHEHRAFAHSKKLLDEVFVPYIFMEWMKLRSYYGAEIDASEDKTLTFWLVNYLEDQGYSAYSSVTGIKLNPDMWYAWTDDILWKHDFA